MLHTILDSRDAQPNIITNTNITTAHPLKKYSMAPETPLWQTEGHGDQRSPPKVWLFSKS